MIFIDVLRCLLKHLFLKLLLIFQNNGPVRQKLFLVLKMQVKMFEIAKNSKLFLGSSFQNLIHYKNALKYYLSYSDLYNADSLLDDAFSFFENTTKVCSKEMKFQDFIPKEIKDVLCYLYEEPSSENKDREEPNKECHSNENLTFDNVDTIIEHGTEQKETEVLTESEIADPAVKCSSPQERKANSPGNIIRRGISDDIECKINKNLECKGEEVVETYPSELYKRTLAEEIGNNCTLNPNMHYNLPSKCIKSEISSKDFPFSNLLSGMASRLKNETNSQSHGSDFLDNVCNNRPEASQVSDHNGNCICEGKTEANVKGCHSVSCEINKKISATLSENDFKMRYEQALESDEDSLNRSMSIDEKLFGDESDAEHASPKNSHLQETFDMKQFCVSDMSKSAYCGRWVNEALDENTDFSMPDIYMDICSPEGAFDKESSLQNTDFNMMLPNIDYEVLMKNNIFLPERVSNNHSSFATEPIGSPKKSPIGVERSPSVPQNICISQDGKSLSMHDQNVRNSNELNTMIENDECSNSKPWPYDLPEDCKVKKDRRFQKRFYKLSREGKMDAVLKEYSDKKNVNSLTASEESLEQESSESVMEESKECTNEEQFGTLQIPAEKSARSKIFDNISQARKRRQGFLPNDRPPLELRVPKFAVQSDSSVKTGYKSSSFLENSPVTSESDNSQAYLQDDISEMDAEGIKNVKSLDKCYYTRVSFNYADYIELPAIYLRDKMESQSGRNIKLRPLFRILNKYCAIEELSIEEQFYKLQKVEALFYDMLYSFYGDKEMHRDTIQCCEIPIKNIPESDEDYELDGDDLVLPFKGMQKDETAKTDMFQGNIINESEEIQSSSYNNHVSAEDTPKQISEEILKIERNTPEDDKPCEEIQKESFRTNYLRKKLNFKRVQRDELDDDLEKNRDKIQKREHYESSDSKISDIEHEALNKIDELDDKKNVENRNSSSRYEICQSTLIPSKMATVESESNVEDGEADNCNDFKAILESGRPKLKHSESFDSEKSKNSSELNEKDQFDLPLNVDKCKSISRSETSQNKK